jgi:hypothetical protein
MRVRSLLDWLPGLAFAALYLATPSRNLALTHDSVFYLMRIAEGVPALDPNHLVFEPLMAYAHRLLALVVPGLNLERAIQVVNGLSGAAALQAGYLTAVRRLRIGRPAASLATAAAGFTFGVWYYSTTVETYIVPLALLAWGFYVLSARRLETRHVAAAAVAHSAAALVHQSAILFGAAAIAALVTAEGVRARRDLRIGLGRAALYLALCTVLVGGAYVLSAVLAGGASSPAEAIAWAKGHGADSGFWAAPPRAFVEAAIGFSRALFGGHYAFAVDAIVLRLQQALPGKYLGDERFLVRTLPEIQALALLALTAATGLLLAGLAAAGAWSLARRRSSADARALGLLALWLFAYVGFFTFWDPQNADFWIVPAFLIWYVLAALVSRPGGLPRSARLAFAAAAAGLLVTTGAGIIRFTSDPQNDFYTVYLRDVPAIVGPDDTLVVGDDWPIARHIGYRLKKRAIYLTNEASARHSPAGIAERIGQSLREGRRVFVADDVLEAKPQAIAVHGEGYADYVRNVAGHLCELRALPAGPHQLQLYEVGSICTPAAADTGRDVSPAASAGLQ